MINIKGNYSREFYIFEKMSGKFAVKGKELSGYLKLEATGDKGKLKVYIENADIFDNVKYYLKFYIINGGTKCICTYTLWPAKGIIEKEADFSCNDFANSGYNVRNAEAAAFIAEEKTDKEIKNYVIMGAGKKDIKGWKEAVHAYESSITAPVAADEPDSRVQRKTYSGETNGTEAVKGKEEVKAAETSEKHQKANQKPYNEQYSPKMNSINNEAEGRINFDTGDHSKETESNIDIEKVREKFDEYFQRVDPFGTGRRDYEWWWVNNPVFLNNILYDFKLKSPLIFKPEIMESQFKYKHIITGIFHDTESNDSYFIYGIPGNGDYDRAPEGFHAVWIKAGFDFQGNNAFGYWLIYFEPSSGRIIKV